MSAIILMSATILVSEAARPASFRMQTVVTDNGYALAEKEVSVKISVRNDIPTSKDIYTETHTVSTDRLGVVTLNVGEGSVISGNWEVVDWSRQPVFIALSVDKGAGYVDAGCSQVSAVPYARFADKSGSLLLTSASGKKFTVSIDEDGNLVTTPIDNE